MIARSKSFSKGGAIIERIMEIQKYTIDQDKLNKILHSKHPKISNEQKQKKQLIVIQGFNKVTGREVPNSFLRHTVKDVHPNIDYDNRKDAVLPRTALFPIRKQKDQRLSELLVNAIHQQKEPQHSKSCRKFSVCNNEHIKTANDLMGARKTFHSIDFQKQLNRPFDQSLKKLSKIKQTQNRLMRANSESNIISYKDQKEYNSLLKNNKVHSFASYTKRQFLTDKQVRGAPQVSGIDCFKINPQKFKSQWKTVNAPKFDSMAKKVLSRYDRDCPHWFTQLSYNVKNNKRSIKSQLAFEAQTDRKLNEVKSSYPLRIAM